MATEMQLRDGTARGHRRLAWRSGAAALLALGLASVQGNEDAATVDLGNLVVTATPDARPESTLPANVSVITAADIAGMNALTVPDVLKFQAGLHVADWTGSGRSSNVDIRGFGETGAANVLVLVDGRRVNSPDLSGIDWTTIPLERIARIEIVRGGAGVLYGDKATAGVINIITRTGADRPLARAETTVGSYGLFKQSLGLSGTVERLRYDLTGSHQESDGYRENSLFRNRSAGLRLHYAGDDDWYELDLAAGVKQDAYGLPGWVAKGQDRRRSNTPNDRAESTEHYLLFAPSFDLAVPGRLGIAVSAREREQESEFPLWFWIGANRIQEYGVNPQYDVEFDLDAMTHRLSVGMAFTQAEWHDLSPVFPSGDADHRDVGYFVYDRIGLFADRLLLDLGYRRSTVTYHYDNFADRTHNLDSARAGITWNYADGSKLFAAIDRSYRAQLLDEFAGPWGAGLPLSPQISLHSQVGVRHRFDERLTTGLTAFRIDTRGEIFFDPALGWLGQNTSYDKTRRTGLELDIVGQPTKRVTLFANYTIMNPHLRGGAYDGNRIPGVADQTASAGVQVLPWQSLVVDLRGRWGKSHRSISDWANTLDKTSGYVVADLRVSYTVWKALTVYAGVNNLFDETYAEYATYGANLYPSPKRNYLAGIQFSKEF